MSYFMVMVGRRIELSDLPGVTILPLAQAQQYLKDRATDLAVGHNLSDVFAICDPALKESADIVAMAEEQLHLGKPLESTALGQVVTACVAAGNSLRIWWANNDPKVHQPIANYSDPSAFKAAIIEATRSNRDIAVVYTPSADTAR
jgi:hypothetical protein